LNENECKENASRQLTDTLQLDRPVRSLSLLPEASSLVQFDLRKSRILVAGGPERETRHRTNVISEDFGGRDFVREGEGLD